TVWVEGVRDWKAVQEQVKEAAGLLPADLGGYSEFRGSVAKYELAPRVGLDVLAERIGFGRVLASDTERRTLLVVHGEAPAPPRHGGDFIRRRVPITALLDRQGGDIADLSRKHGRDRVVTFRVRGLKTGTSAGWHAVQRRLRELMDDPARAEFTPWTLQPGNAHDFSAAPVADAAKLRDRIRFARVEVADPERRAFVLDATGIEER
ncbi:MAG: hypothetical protein K2W96_17545, partial [Gemmataceae bacterium]|nr:hypothetical protein [Gemmataceae bacterium]